MSDDSISLAVVINYDLQLFLFVSNEFSFEYYITGYLYLFRNLNVRIYVHIIIAMRVQPSFLLSVESARTAPPFPPVIRWVGEE